MKPPDIVVKTLSTLLTALASAGFVAVVGGAILWARFHAAKLPAEQAVAAVPNHELVVIGAVNLVGFVLAAVGALICVYAIDNEGTTKPGTRAGLLVLAVGEMAVAILFAHFDWWLTLLLVVAFGVAALFVGLLGQAAVHFWRGRDAQGRTVGSLLRWAGDQLAGHKAVQHAIAIAVLGVGVWVVGWVDQWLVVVIWAVLALVALGAWHAVTRAANRRVLALVLLGYGAIALVRFESSLAIISALALGLASLNLAVAYATGNRFALYGVSVFLSVIAFGGGLSFVRTRDNPKLQPVAVLLKDGAGIECGLYVTETDSRIYMASVQAVPGHRGAAIADGSGRLFWVPRDKVERTRLGQLEKIITAQDDSTDLRNELAAQTPQKEPLKDCESRPAAPPARQTTQRVLAERFQPTVVVDRGDGFWPISVLTLFKLRHGDTRTCRRAGQGDCTIDVTRPNQLPWSGGSGEWLEYPADETNAGQQHDEMIAALGTRDPVSSAHEYFFVTGAEAPGGTVSVQYWFYYGFNQLKVRLPGITLGRAGFHEGDFENVSVLLSRAHTPVYVWMSRHSDEGRPFVWNETGLEHSGEHLTVYSALGSHATYDSCGTQRRRQAPFGLINDRPQCNPSRQLPIEAEATPMSDLSSAPWACWHGNFGHAFPGPRNKVLATAFADAPLSPLWQQKFNPTAQPCTAVPRAPARADVGEEVLDSATAAKLRAAGGRLDGLFNSCSAWSKPPASGVYLVACNERSLADFFKSGLTNPGGNSITVRSPDGQAEPASIPAVYRRPDAFDLDGVSISALKRTTVSVYAVCYSGDRPLEATFPSVALPAGRPVTLQTGESEWTLDGRTVAPVGPGSKRCG